MTARKVKTVCAECGSDDVYADAWVGINHDKIITFDQTYCRQCEDECNTTEVPADTPEAATTSPQP
jgi:hypothetical protein